MKESLRKLLGRPLPLFLLAFAVSCGDGSHTGHDHAEATAGGHAHGHSHIAPHGGVIVVLGDEAFHLELVHDRDAGRLTLYVLDGHMENFIRLAVPSLELVCQIDGVEQRLTLAAVAQSATGETVGNTSQFSGQASWLRNSGSFEGLLKSIAIRGTEFTDQNFTLPAAAGNP